MNTRLIAHDGQNSPNGLVLASALIRLDSKTFHPFRSDSLTMKGASRDQGSPAPPTSGNRDGEMMRMDKQLVCSNRLS